MTSSCNAKHMINILKAVFLENSSFNTVGIKIKKEIWKISWTLKYLFVLDPLLREGASALCKECQVS